ncbi:MAG: alpha/beta fold hydrolase [Oscillospiraceae bacterium]|nr:alpha/beta fold hydrolase [Oscillospiraceae bacterium]
MKQKIRIFPFLLLLCLLCLLGACSKTTAPEASEQSGDIDWAFYNELAETYVTAMANSDFDQAYEMFDDTMKLLVSVSALETEIWTPIIEEAGAFEEILSIRNVPYDGYYICFTISRHEDSGVILQIVFSEKGFVAGLFVNEYITIEDRELISHDGFTDYPILLGDGTEFPIYGLLSMPDDIVEKIPAVVLVHGSGSHDMDETVFLNKPFRDIAEYLAANGIAAIRYDKRAFTHGLKMLELFGNDMTIYEETIEDAILAAELLKADYRIDPDRVFILGHSLGGMLAPRIHAQGGSFAGIISLAGSPRSLLEIAYDQQLLMLEAMPEGEEKTTALAEFVPYDEQIAALMDLSEEEAKTTAILGNASLYYFREMEEHPVSDYIENIHVPFLILQGADDFQIFADIDYVLWQELLAGRDNVTYKLYEGLNHLFMPSIGASIMEFQDEYLIESRVETQVLQDIVEWIKAN